MKIIALGDVHGEFGRLNTIINRKRPSIILQCGDFAFHWEFISDYNVGKIKAKNTKVYYCLGNHENMIFAKSSDYPPGSITEVDTNVFLCAFGSVLTLPDGRNVLFCGGADSIDKGYRKEYVSWWSNETIQPFEFKALPDPVTIKIDIVISHTCPNYFITKLPLNERIKEKSHDPSCAALDTIFDMYKPTEWYFGHFHLSKHGTSEQCKWHCLDCLEQMKV